MNFKDRISEHLKDVVADYYEGARLVQVQHTDEGLFCDFDLSAPINKQSYDAIVQNMVEIPLNCAYELTSYSGVYEDGDSNKKMLQRIYIVAFESKHEFDLYKQLLQTAQEHDHKVLGTQLGLFSTSEDIGSGLVLWNPKGATVRYLMEQFGQTAHILNGYQWVYSPHIGKAKLWETSGHLEFYKDSMYSPISIDGDEYYLKPMNCPFHVNIYNNELRSYRDLPVKLAEYGAVYRYELSGALQGLSRVRGFTQDDAHIICTPEQIQEEVTSALKFSLYVLQSFGLSDFKAYIATKPKKKFIGSEDEWNRAIEVLKQSVTSVGMEYAIDDGGGAFYGPKIDLKLKDVINREWQCSTIQFDFNLPQRFEMSYIGKDGKKHTPFMVHRALFGSMERFFALLVEHYKGDFPLWLAPVQFGIVPINQSHNDYCKRLEVELKKRFLRVRADYEETHMKDKIKHFELEKIPFVLVIGDKDIAINGFSVRSRGGGNLGVMNIQQLCEFIEPELDKGKPKYILDDFPIVVSNAVGREGKQSRTQDTLIK